MRANLVERIQSPSVYFYDLYPKQDDYINEIIIGLQKSPKNISPKFFYNEQGSKLFSQICELKEYYPTRTEMKILQSCVKELAEIIDDDCAIIEYGCGSSEKIQILLDAMPACQTYVGVDISKEALLELADFLSASYLDLEVIALAADFTKAFQLPFQFGKRLKKIAFFPGSSFGNFEKDMGHRFLQNVANTVGSGGGLLIGVDLKKSPYILNDAYNDSQGVTAEFNLNILNRLNQICASHFNHKHFEHHAFYNEEEGRIEMHLKSLIDHSVEVAGSNILFKRGENIHTENSYKYSIEEFQYLAVRAGWLPQRYWTDDESLFSVHYLEAV